MLIYSFLQSFILSFSSRLLYSLLTYLHSISNIIYLSTSFILSSILYFILSLSRIILLSSITLFSSRLLFKHFSLFFTLSLVHLSTFSSPLYSLHFPRAPSLTCTTYHPTHNPLPSHQLLHYHQPLN